MAESLIVVGGIVSFVQLLGYIIKTSEAVTKLCDEIEDAPLKVHRIKDRLCLLRKSVEEIQAYLQVFDDEIILPPDLREVLMESIRRTNNDIKEVGKETKKSCMVLPGSLRKRLRWAIVERRKMEKLLTQLDESGSTLDRAIQLVNLRNSLLSCLYTKQSVNLMEQMRATLINGRKIADSDEHISPSVVSKASYERPLTPAKVYQTMVFIRVDSWLRSLGFYGSIKLISRGENNDKVRIVVGFKFPAWMSKISIDFEIEFARLCVQELGVRILPGQVKIQTRVSRESQFMVACVKGDVKLIKQHLEEKTATVRDRTICTGSTPLMLTIEGQHLDAMKCLLDYGADPNMGDDDQVLPIFATLGMNPRRSKHFPQLPPQWGSWLAAFRILVDYGASVHEVNYDRSLTTLNITRDGHGVKHIDYAEPSALEFFRLLHDQCYFEFSTASQGIWCALLTAIRQRTECTETLEFLSEMGVDFARIAMTGHSSLHWAAEMAYDVRCLEYLCSTAAVDNINRQDPWGWTPLHYAVASRHYGYDEVAFDKIQSLLRNGADPEIKGRRHPMFYLNKLAIDEFSSLELCRLVDRDLSARFEELVEQTPMGQPDRHNEDVFSDALEEQV